MRLSNSEASRNLAGPASPAPASLLGTVALAAATLAAPACSWLGPTAISNGRAAYNDVINRTADEQLLSLIVRERYRESFGMLDVASVTATIESSSRAEAEFPIGPQTASNLVPLRVGVVYEERPTISYVPVDDDALLAHLLAPISVEHMLLVDQLAERNSTLLRTLARRVNGLLNPSYGASPSADAFTRVFDLFVELRTRGVVDIARNIDSDEVFIVIHDYTGDSAAKVEEWKRLLGLEGLEATDEDAVYVPFHVALGRPSPDSIQFEPRSLMDVIRDVGRFIELPQPHVERGIVDAAGRADGDEPEPLIRIRSSRWPPSDVAVAAWHRGYCFFIEASDLASKDGFLALRALFGLRAARDGEENVPVLTIPVGGA